ncbi:S49 family peptidase [Pseudoalteromonas ulvae]|uniref:Peptidase S49 domain-containing protein n=1 Tax=Pseudoalteromonas ulvae TaxID=107327 RepID=A0A244CVI2_PSEDV|nr:S49 family peptidase [Pseudoalteromonas ulvae]OUL59259.1 hypothetical protein B1199_03040 [Pseudoalteromonas ulvae]
MSENSFAHILSRACNQAQFIEPTYANTFFSYLGQRAGAHSLVDINGDTLSQADMQVQAASFSNPRERERPYQVQNGLAILPVSGTLLHKYGYINPRSGSTGYDGILARIDDAINDPEIKAIMLDIDSPGGEAAGCFDAANRIKQMSQIKPIYALCYDTMCSAAMAIGSACTERWITQSGRAGSVGVVIAHASYEEKLKTDGVKITLIHSGKHKVDGNPYQDLSADVLGKIQANLDKNRDLFAELVASNIGMSKQAVLDTEARVYQGQEAVDIGFANKVVNGFDAIPQLLDIINSTSFKTNQTTGVAMSLKTNEAPAAGSATQAGAQATAPTAEQTAEQATAQTPAQAAAAERERCQSILTAPDAQGKSAMATHLAFNTSMSVDDAVALLKVSPAEQATAEQASVPAQQMADALTTAMASTEQPNLETTGDADELSADQKAEQQLLASFSAATGAK